MPRYVYGPSLQGQWSPSGGPAQVRDARITAFSLGNTAEGVNASIVVESAAPGLVRPSVVHVGVTDQTPPADPAAFLADPAVLHGSAPLPDGIDSLTVPIAGLVAGVRQFYQSVLEFNS